MSYVRDTATTAELLKRSDVDAIEIHTTGKWVSCSLVYLSLLFLCYVAQLLQYFSFIVGESVCLVRSGTAWVSQSIM